MARLTDEEVQQFVEAQRKLGNEFKASKLLPGDVGREKVVAAIRASLPEFCDRNGIELDERIMDNIARWVSGVVPPGMYRQGCGAAALGCACPGTCKWWFPVGDAPE